MKNSVIQGTFGATTPESNATKPMRNDHSQNQPNGDGAWS